MTKEVKKAKRPEEQLRVEETFMATPPLECVQLLLSLFMTKRPGKKKRKLGVWDISRAHFMGRVEWEIYIQLLEEDRTRKEDNGVPMCGRLLRSNYGTQDASHIFQKDYSNWLCEKGAEFSPLCPVQDRGHGPVWAGAW